MSSLTLYHIANDLRELLDTGIDLETGEMSPELGQALARMEHKVPAVAAFILNEDATADAIASAMEKLDRKKEAHRRKADAMRRYLLDAMRMTGTTAIQSEDKTIDVRFYPERDESVDVFQPELLPSDVMRIPTPKPAPDKAKIKALLKSGQDVPGARLVRKDRLEIR